MDQFSYAPGGGRGENGGGEQAAERRDQNYNAVLATQQSCTRGPRHFFPMNENKQEEEEEVQEE